MQASLDVAGRRDPSIVAGSGPGRPRERGSAREGHPAPTEPATRREVWPRFVTGEPLRRRHAWVAVVLAMTSGPADPSPRAGLGLAMARATGDPGPAWPAGGGVEARTRAGEREGGRQFSVMRPSGAGAISPASRMWAITSLAIRSPVIASITGVPSAKAA